MDRDVEREVIVFYAGGRTRSRRVGGERELVTRALEAALDPRVRSVFVRRGAERAKFWEESR